MNTPRMSINYNTSSDFPSLGSFTIDGFDDLPLTTQVVPQYSEARSHTQFHIIVKRDDALYKIFSILNTLFSVIAILLIVASFVMVFYCLITITEVAEMVTQIKEHNALENVPTR